MVRVLRGILGALLWLLGSLLGLVALVLCLTIVLLPLGIPLLMLARRVIGVAMKLMLPRHVAHPVDEAKRSVRKQRRRAAKRLSP